MTRGAIILMGLAMAGTAYFGLPALAETVYVHTTGYPAPGTYGNDTAATLYLRPINMSIVGPSQFGSGYPRTYTAYPYPVPAEQRSGIQRANEYLQSSGWNAWQAEKRALLAERLELTNRVRSLEERLADLEKVIEGLNRQLKAREDGQ